MFSTVKSVFEYTGVDLEYVVNTEYLIKLATKRGFGLDITQIDRDYEKKAFIRKAQGIIESFVGKDEIDIENPSDLLLLDKMTSYQVAYMIDNEDVVWNQVALTSQGQTDFIVNFNSQMHAPWIAPLAVIASRGLSWKKSRSFRTGKIFQLPKISNWRNS